MKLKSKVNKVNSMCKIIKIYLQKIIPAKYIKKLDKEILPDSTWPTVPVISLNQDKIAAIAWFGYFKQLG